MSIVVRYAPVPSSTIEQYDEVMRRLQESGEMPADGFDYHVAFLSDGQLLVSEVWDSQEQLQAFGERIMPLLADVALEHSGQPEIFRGPQHHQALTRALNRAVSLALVLMAAAGGTANEASVIQIPDFSYPWFAAQ